MLVGRWQKQFVRPCRDSTHQTILFKKPWFKKQSRNLSEGCHGGNNPHLDRTKGGRGALISAGPSAGPFRAAHWQAPSAFGGQPPALFQPVGRQRGEDLHRTTHRVSGTGAFCPHRCAFTFRSWGCQHCSKDCYEFLDFWQGIKSSRHKTVRSLDMDWNLSLRDNTKVFVF